MVKKITINNTINFGNLQQLLSSHFALIKIELYRTFTDFVLREKQTKRTMTMGSQNNQSLKSSSLKTLSYYYAYAFPHGGARAKKRRRL